jgi:outer membrane protein TolC
MESSFCKYLCWLALCFFINDLVAMPYDDTLKSKSLSEIEFLSILRNFHPVARQATIDVERARAMQTASRGGFDPYIESNANRKRLGGDLYYQYYRSELVIPTWYGVEIKTGIENASGLRVNPESSLGDYSYLGVSVPLLKDLVIDKRRAALKQASLFVNISKAERDNLVNDLFFEALSSYWEWVNAYQLLNIIDRAVRANEDRLRFIRLEYLQGNRPAIDTTEALSQLQQFYSMQAAARQEFLNTGIALSAYLWKAEAQPYILPEDIIPDKQAAMAAIRVKIPLLDELLQQVRISHPKIISLQWKQNSLEIDRKLKFQGLLPSFDIKANVLNKGYNVTKGLNSALLENNYAFGFDFSLPLRLSEGRGSYRDSKWKLVQNQMETDRQVQLLENKVKKYYNDLVYLRRQIELGSAAVENLQRLVNGENARLEIGESSLFLVNARELKWIEAQQKLVELQTKFGKSLAAIQWASGTLK